MWRTLASIVELRVRRQYTRNAFQYVGNLSEEYDVVDPNLSHSTRLRNVL